MSEKENSGKSWIRCLLILLVIFTVLWAFYNHYSYNHYLSNKNTWIYIVLYFLSLFISMIVSHYITTLLCLINISKFFSRIRLQFAVLIAIEILAIIPIIFISCLTLMRQIIITLFLALVILAIVFLASTKFFYIEPECWKKRLWLSVKEWYLNFNSSFDKFLQWLALFPILLVFILYAVVSLILYFIKLKITLENVENILNSFNGDLFNLTFNLFLVAFFSFIISVFSQLFFKTNNLSKITDEEDSAFISYFLRTKLVIILSITLFIVYALTHVFILTHINNKISLAQVLSISVSYTLFILALFYLLKKFFEVINFAMPVHRLQTKIKVLSRSPLNKGTLRLWNSFWKNEKFDDALHEGIFLSDFIVKIVYHKKLFQLKEEVSVATDALRGFSESISSRHPEALAMEVLNIAPRRRTQPKRLQEYLTEVLKSYKDIVCEDRLICEEPDSLALSYKQYFKEEAYKSGSKYQYLDELIYQLLVTMRKSIEKLQENGYFKRDKNRCRALYCKFKDIVGVLCGFKCIGKDNDRLKNALNAESAKKWIEEAGNLFKIIDNVDCIPQALYIPVEEAVRILKKGEINADALGETFSEWNSVCAQGHTKIKCVVFDLTPRNF